MAKLRSDGIAIVFITHFLDQVYEVSDRVTILRNGEAGRARTTRRPFRDSSWSPSCSVGR